MHTAALLTILGTWAIAVWTIYRPASRAHVDGFADLYAVPVSTETTELIRRALTRTRRFRSLGAALSITLMSIIAPDAAGIWSILGAAAFGLALGSVVDELTRPRAMRSSATATLERRSVRTYVERWVIVFFVSMIVVVLAQLWVTLDLGRVDGLLEPSTGSGRTLIRGRAVALIAAVVAVVVGAIGSLIRRIVSMEVRAENHPRSAVLHAVRTSAVLSLVGAALLTLGVTGAWLAVSNSFADGSSASALQWFDGIAIIVSGISIAFGASLSLFATPRRSPRLTRPETAE